MKEFKVNEYITLKLEEGQTNIYIKNQLFQQCKFLLLHIPIDRISNFDEIESIDEAAEKLDSSMEGERKIKYEIPPEVQFWGHCSNMQVWAENNYDSRLLHSNLAFPLLKKLTEVGDPVAKRVFKEEIAKRINSGFGPCIWFLKDEDYFEFLSHEEQLMALLHPEEADALLEIEHSSGIKLEYTFQSDDLLDDKGFLAENKRIIRLSLYNCGIKTLPDSIANFTSLKELYLAKNQLTTLPDSIGNLSCLEVLDLSENQFTPLPDFIGNLISLRKLGLSDNRLSYLPDSLGNLCSLVLLNLQRNNLVSLPDSVKKLSSLRFIELEGTPIENLNS